MKTNEKICNRIRFWDGLLPWVMDNRDGAEKAVGVSYYPRWRKGLYCDAQANRYRQHPLDYIEAMMEAMHMATSRLLPDETASIGVYGSISKAITFMD